MTTITPRRASAFGTRTRATLFNGTALARLALGVVALHVIDDNYLQPEPGTTAADHLVSGLVPLAVIVAAISRYERARAGVRAALALALGLFGITALPFYGLSVAHGRHRSGVLHPER